MKFLPRFLRPGEGIEREERKAINAAGGGDDDGKVNRAFVRFGPVYTSGGKQDLFLYNGILSKALGDTWLKCPNFPFQGLGHAQSLLISCLLISSSSDDVCVFPSLVCSTQYTYLTNSRVSLFPHSRQCPVCLCSFFGSLSALGEDLSLYWGHKHGPYLVRQRGGFIFD